MSGLWEEELVKKMGPGRVAAAFGPHSAHQAVLWPHLPGGREAFFSPAQKKALWARQGSSREGRTVLELGAQWRGENKTHKTKTQGDGEK